MKEKKSINYVVKDWNYKLLWKRFSWNKIIFSYFQPCGGGSFQKVGANIFLDSRSSVLHLEMEFKACAHFFLSKFCFSPNDSPSETMKDGFYFN